MFWNVISASQLRETNCALPPRSIYFCSRLPVPVLVSLRKLAVPQITSTWKAPEFLTGSFLMQTADGNHHDKSTEGDCQFPWTLEHLAFLMHLRALISYGMQSIIVPVTTPSQLSEWLSAMPFPSFHSALTCKSTISHMLMSAKKAFHFRTSA